MAKSWFTNTCHSWFRISVTNLQAFLKCPDAASGAICPLHLPSTAKATASMWAMTCELMRRLRLHQNALAAFFCRVWHARMQEAKRRCHLPIQNLNCYSNAQISAENLIGDFSRKICGGSPHHHHHLFPSTIHRLARHKLHCCRISKHESTGSLTKSTSLRDPTSWVQSTNSVIQYQSGSPSVRVCNAKFAK